MGDNETPDIQKQHHKTVNINKVPSSCNSNIAMSVVVEKKKAKQVEKNSK